MGKTLTVAQKTFTDLYDSYVLNLSSDIVAVPCDQYGRATEDCTVEINYAASVGTLSVGATCEIRSSMVPSSIICNTDIDGKIFITVLKDTELKDDSEIGFDFTTDNANAFTFTRYITLVKIKSGTNGENARSFQIKSELGDTFTEGISEITMTAVAFDGLTEITDATYAWYHYIVNVGWAGVLDDSESIGENEVTTIFSKPSLKVKKNDEYANSVFKCVVTYSNGETDEDYYQLKTAVYNFESTVKFFGGTNTISSSNPFLIAYIDLYKDYQKVEGIKADHYYYHQDNKKNASGLAVNFDNVDNSYKKDGSLMYVIYKDESVAPSDTTSTYEILTQSSPSTAGEVRGGGSHDYGASITLTAIPGEGYVFEKWIEDGSTVNPKTMTVTGSATYTASFAKYTADSYTITAKSADPNMGSASGSGTYETGSVITLAAAANIGYVFEDWYENDIEKNWPKSINLTVTKNRTLIAKFRKINSGVDTEYTIENNKNESIMVYKNDVTYIQFIPSTSGTYRFYSEENVAMDCYLYDSSMSLLAADTVNSVDDNFSITAYCAAGEAYYFGVTISEYEYGSAQVLVYLEDVDPISYTITVASNDSSMGSVSGSGTYEAGTSVILKATANSGYKFVRWKDGFMSSERIVTVTGNKTYTAVFAVATTPYFTATISADGQGEFDKYYLSSDQYGTANLGTTGNFTENDGRLGDENYVYYYAKAASGKIEKIAFITNGGEPQYDYSDSWVSSDRTTLLYAMPVIELAYGTTQEVKVYFVGNADSGATYYNITTYVSPSGAGTVTGGGAYVNGTSITLTATPAGGYTFKQWNDGNTNATRTITVSGNATYMATFEAVSSGTTHYTLTLIADPTNGGTVSGGGTYASGEYATISATPNSDYEFVGWYEEGMGTIATNERMLKIESDREIKAMFKAISNGDSGDTVQITIQPAFSAWGSVSVNGSAATNTSKAYSFNVGDKVTLQATPNSGYSFSCWYDNNGGTTISTANPYTFIVASTTPKTISAM